MIANEIAEGTLVNTPFPYFVSHQGLREDTGSALLSWFELDAPWNLRKADFYEQYEFSLREVPLPATIEPLRNTTNVAKVRRFVEAVFRVALTERVDISAHKLVSGQRIRIHNDLISGAETHRVLIQLNRGWVDDNGGLLI
ncbi:MAG: hypothetical protein MN733_21165, partial [Nitrososphaera sp.]|nr:hypothetical protein [Nitrososphaera sp.]